MRIGHGYDVHRLVAGRPLVLGGVIVPSDVGLDGHSDADVLTHAVIDALLGAAALGDIGSHFPDTDDEWQGADSLDLLRTVVARLARRRLRHRQRRRDGRACSAPSCAPTSTPCARGSPTGWASSVDRVSVKATTGEGMGFVGTGEGAAAHAVALSRRRRRT